MLTMRMLPSSRRWRVHRLRDGRRGPAQTYTGSRHHSPLTHSCAKSINRTSPLFPGSPRRHGQVLSVVLRMHGANTTLSDVANAGETVCHPRGFLNFTNFVVSTGVKDCHFGRKIAACEIGIRVANRRPGGGGLVFAWAEWTSAIRLAGGVPLRRRFRPPRPLSESNSTYRARWIGCHVRAFGSDSSQTEHGEGVSLSWSASAPRSELARRSPACYEFPRNCQPR